jgi:hypothetical protein
LAQEAIKLRVLEQRHIWITADGKKIVPPTEDPVIAVTSAEQFHGEISAVIADAVNELTSPETNPKAAADHFSILQRARHVFKTPARYFTISVHKPENIAARNRSTGIHLRRAPAAAGRETVAQFGDRFGYIFGTGGVDQNDFRKRRTLP